ncbi:MAG: 3-oxoacyl-[acyl-carrier-protein] reductase [Deltaproteobacteria bacterium]|nr:3-oxoacyl-[acyl-carrier-protein] reductase [Deltaproteobacteria bacterium]
MEQDFIGKIIVVTGGTRGIGAAISKELIQRGAIVVAIYAQNDAAARRFLEGALDRSRVRTIKADVTDVAAIQSAFDQILKEFEKIDGLVNNAGIVRDGLIIRMKEEDWDSVLNVNLTGAFRCTRLAARAMMRQRAGAIVNICSVVAELGNIGQANYVTSKAGLVGLTKASARELAPRGVIVNAVAPGWIETEMTQKIPQEVRDHWLKLIPLQRLGKPEEVSALVCFLLSDRAKYITGQLFHMGGGLYM